MAVAAQPPRGLDRHSTSGAGHRFPQRLTDEEAAAAIDDLLSQSSPAESPSLEKVPVHRPLLTSLTSTLRSRGAISRSLEALGERNGNANADLSTNARSFGRKLAAAWVSGASSAGAPPRHSRSGLVLNAVDQEIVVKGLDAVQAARVRGLLTHLDWAVKADPHITAADFFPSDADGVPVGGSSGRGIAWWKSGEDQHVEFDSGFEPIASTQDVSNGVGGSSSSVRVGSGGREAASTLPPTKLRPNLTEVREKERGGGRQGEKNGKRAAFETQITAEDEAVAKAWPPSCFARDFDGNDDNRGKAALQLLKLRERAEEAHGSLAAFFQAMDIEQRGLVSFGDFHQHLVRIGVLRFDAPDSLSGMELFKYLDMDRDDLLSPRDCIRAFRLAAAVLNGAAEQRAKEARLHERQVQLGLPETIRTAKNYIFTPEELVRLVVLRRHLVKSWGGFLAGLRRMDVDGDGFIKQRSFVSALISDYCISVEEANELFRILDVSRFGTISYKQLQAMERAGMLGGSESIHAEEGASLPSVDAVAQGFFSDPGRLDGPTPTSARDTVGTGSPVANVALPFDRLHATPTASWKSHHPFLLASDAANAGNSRQASPRTHIATEQARASVEEACVTFATSSEHGLEQAQQLAAAAIEADQLSRHDQDIENQRQRRLAALHKAASSAVMSTVRMQRSKASKPQGTGSNSARSEAVEATAASRGDSPEPPPESAGLTSPQSADSETTTLHTPLVPSASVGDVVPGGTESRRSSRSSTRRSRATPTTFTMPPGATVRAAGGTS
eukprot:TRINITY_DN62892_c0_g1_i1.p1 TRINITY_DN62892_c0_g1~~TRINITY_DN62892_c0_g1_i1.p1  ORF type:complete len:786 (+),score=134.94 TRINITY_DN62892_c0_g1_i1:157-2514(+)